MPDGAPQALRNAAKLTREQVAAIKASRDSARRLAKTYGVSRATIGCIRRGKTWTDVLPEATPPACVSGPGILDRIEQPPDRPELPPGACHVRAGGFPQRPLE